MSALTSAVALCGAVALGCFVISLLTREYSWVDRLWSLTPQLYVTWFAWTADFASAPTNLMLLLAWLWGARLTFNFARKGGYAPGGEDYRWAELRKRMSPALFQVFNLLFISGFQNALLLGLALPAWAASRSPQNALSPADLALGALFLIFLAGETLADNQQWRFQRDKQARLAGGEPIAQPFLTTGLFRYSRHPNFFCEQVLWWIFYGLGARASGEWWNLTVLGPLVLTGLFHGSTNFTEELSLAKYPGYADYQKRVSRLLPWFSTAPRDSSS